jgi:hypothetical protein
MLLFILAGPFGITRQITVKQVDVPTVELLAAGSSP